MYHRQLIRQLTTLYCLLLIGGCTTATLPQQSTTPEIPAAQAAEAVAPVESIAEPTIWDVITSQYQLDLSVEQPRLEAEYRWYSQHPRYIKRVTQRGARYLHFITEQAALRNMPGELVLLPIVESAFDPFAYSHGRASGVWQFIPATGREFGLHQDWWHDGRRDIRASTIAALDYLNHLAKRFDGDWLLALASYNAGATTVRRAIRKNKRKGLPTDYWSLPLPRETRAYVPKLLALAKLINNPEVADIVLPEINNEPYFTTVDTQGQIDLWQVAELADITLDEVYKLNPSYNRWATHPDGPHSILLPIDSADVFKQRLQQLPEEHRVQWRKYSVQPGDAIDRIARRYQTTAAVIRQANRLTSDQIRIGQSLMIPTSLKSSNQYQHSLSQRLERIQKRRQPSNSTRSEYTVKSGDSFWKIANKNKISIKDLARWNNLAPRDPLKIGQKLVIYSHSASAQRQVIRKVNYKVRRGDSLSSVASKFKVPMSDLVEWNTDQSKQKYLKPGQRLTLYVDVTR